MIIHEGDGAPSSSLFDVAIVAVGYERRCRWITDQLNLEARLFLGLEFGFLPEASYPENRAYFEKRSCKFIPGLEIGSPGKMAELIESAVGTNPTRIFVDISSMSREMIANVAIAIESVRSDVDISVGYAPSEFSSSHGPAPIRFASPVKPALSGWSSRPERPLGAIFGLGCEPGMALGALQVLEPNKTWVLQPKGIDPKFDAAMRKANEGIDDIFDVTPLEYDITMSTIARARFAALLNAVDGDFRIIAVPFGPKIFAWLVLATVIFEHRSSIGIWTFSSKEHAAPVDRNAAGAIFWHNISLRRSEGL